MATHIVLLVLLASLLHASWNALVKSSPNQPLDIVLVTSGAALLAACLLPTLSLPAPASLPFIATSVIIHVGYFTLVGTAYKLGDMGNIYPIMRGAPPLLVALASFPLLGQALSPAQWLGIFVISGGIFSLLLGARGKTATGMALLNAVLITAYTLVDGTGARLSGAPQAYVLWMYLLTAPLIFALAWWLGPRLSPHKIIPHFRARWPYGLAGGACTLAAYCLVLTAMTHAPVALVAALRESAIIFGALISVFILKEKAGFHRPAAAAIILLGIIILKLA